ncbi:Ribosomal large subunit pseudouridine synthase E [Dyadobacter sp. CECT 9275]|uniref:Pseudouridine synthase n=1 Tax=Dyadobacter helix TaxID=2822344 RepID=A0A916JEL9_9BACT|nr:pseudouridine synthase [Dyadobacter sp. CECT 9275]CAG5007601.1 Ribosomal large subunit pseudouridine synthase E [Dyadobacter sp. CECT 9275]
MPEPVHRYFIINKPPDMVSQFVSPDKVGLLGDLDYEFPEGTHAVGRLDSNSEGLLILTTNKRVTNLLFLGDVPHKRVYIVHVAHEVTPETLELLRTGIEIRIKGGVNYRTTPCEVDIVTMPVGLASRYANERKVPDTWLRITLTEGKYHQVRKMVRTAGHRCKRLIRVSIENLELGDLPPGGVREIEESDFFEKLNIDPNQ